MAKNFIKSAIKHPGALHNQLGIPKNKKIPPGKLYEAAKNKGKLGQRARFAITLKKLHPKEGSKSDNKKDKEMGVHHTELHKHYKAMAEHHKKMAESHSKLAEHHKRMS